MSFEELPYFMTPGQGARQADGRAWDSISVTCSLIARPMKGPLGH